MNREYVVPLLVKRDGDTCWWCHLSFTTRGAMLRTIEHVVPRSLGGTDDLDNLRLAHRFCNAVRGRDDFETARQVARQRPVRHRGDWSSPAARALRKTVLEEEG